MLDVEILHAVVEDEHVGLEIRDRDAAGARAVFVNEHGHIAEAACEHVRLVAGPRGIEQQLFPVMHDARLELAEIFPAKPAQQGQLPALVAATEDRHVAPAVFQLAREALDHGRLARAADGEIAHADDHHAELPRLANADAVEPDARLRDAAKKPRQRVEQPSQEQRTLSEPALQDDVGRELLEAIQRITE